MTKGVAAEMKNLNIPDFANAGLMEFLARHKHDGPAGASVHRKLWSMIAGPFRRSIRARFRFALTAALIGITVMAVIAGVSGYLLLDRFRGTVAEATEEMMPAHHLQISLHEAERLAGRYVIDHDPSALTRFQEAAAEVERRFQVLTRRTAAPATERRKAESTAIEDAYAEWQEAREAAQRAFQLAPDAAEALSRLHAALDRAHKKVSHFHHVTMKDMGDQMVVGETLAWWSHLLTSVATLVGYGLLTVAAILVGRSVLHPIARLQAAADRLRKKDLSHRVQLRNTQDELGQLGKAINSAAAALQRMYHELERRSTHDGLTAVLNRAAFEERLAAECKSADRHERPLSLLMVDIDFFKRVNDKHGHQAGDRVLQTLARVLDQTTRPGDVVARYGGEEFTVILPETDQNGALAMAERVRKCTEKTAFECATAEDIGVTVSIGCTTRQPCTLILDDFVKAVDEALYRAKDNGRNQVCMSKPSRTKHRAHPQTAVA